MSIRMLLVAVLCVYGLMGCSTLRPPLTPELSNEAAPQTYHYERLSPQPGNRDDTIVMVSVSGGGMRAAAFSFGVLDAMRSAEDANHPGTRWLDQIDGISGVSGGSFTAAYYAMNPDRFFDDYPTKVLGAKLGTGLERQLDNPLNLFRLGSPWFATSNLMENYLDTTVFQGATYGDLARRGQLPFLMITATDLTAGTAFEFSSDEFLAICANLNSVPLARAVTASSAIPGLIAPIIIPNRRGRCPATEQALNPTRTSVSVADDALQSALERRRYIHLIDGGLSDNLGVRSLFEGAGRLDAWRSFAAQPNTPQRVVLVLVDADPGPDLAINRSARHPSIRRTALAAVRVAIGNRSEETRQHVAAALAEVKALWGKGGQSAPLDVHILDVRLENALRNAKVTVNAPLGLDLEPDAVKTLVRLGGDETRRRLVEAGLTSSTLDASSNSETRTP